MTRRDANIAAMELSLPAICDALAIAYPERECLIFRDRRFTWAEVADRTRRLAAADPDRARTDWSADDLYIVYTGGTTGYPKGVLWRQADFLVACTGLRRPDGTDFESVEEVVARSERGARLRTLPAPPLMHGA